MLKRLPNQWINVTSQPCKNLRTCFFLTNIMFPICRLNKNVYTPKRGNSFIKQLHKNTFPIQEIMLYHVFKLMTILEENWRNPCKYRCLKCFNNNTIVYRISFCGYICSVNLISVWYIIQWIRWKIKIFFTSILEYIRRKFPFGLWFFCSL